MKCNRDNKGFTLVEIVVVLAILGILMAVLVPKYLQYVDKSKESIVKQEAGEFHHAVEIAYTEILHVYDGKFQWQCTVGTKAPDADSATAFKNGKVCDRITNFWLTSKVTPAHKKQGIYFLSNAVVQIMGLDKDSALSSLPISSVVPESSNSATKMSLGKEAQFQILFDNSGHIVTEYCRNGYFVRIEGAAVTSVKLKNQNDSRFTRFSAFRNYV